MDDAALIEGLLARGLATKTVACYLAAIRRARRDLDLETVGAAELVSWVERELTTTRSMRSLTRSALKAYWSLTGRQGPWAAVPVPRRRRMRCRALDEPQAAALAAVARERALKGTRKGLAVLLGLYGGLRRSEIAGVRWSQVSADGWLTVAGKGSERCIPLHPVLAGALEAARTGCHPPVRARRPRDHDRVFVGLAGGPLNPTTVWTWVQELSAQAALPPVQTHVLRHTALASALDATGDLRAVQELAGHARPETTAGYTRVRAERLRRAVAAICYEEAAG
ncbi:MAG: tyrosine-type recombinase/integrase [Actinomycetota bacterium]|nr:tyrosine-type recombinase/integrase [Actinomycetota bacterium]